MLEVFADVTCPFAHVSLCRLVTRRATVGREELPILVRSWPLEIVNGEPFDAELIDEEIEVLRQSVAPDLFHRFDPAAWPASSLPALALTAAGYAVAPTVGEAVALELRDLLFEKGVDVSDPTVLAGVADRHGLSIEAANDHTVVEADLEEGRGRGVVGSPHYFLDGRDDFCPTLDVSKPEGSLRVQFDPVSFEALSQAAFPDR